MLKLKQTFLKRVFTHLDTTEQKAIKILDLYFSLGESTYQLKEHLGIGYHTADRFLKSVKADKEFYDEYLRSRVKTIDDIKNDDLTKQVYKRLLQEIDDCEKNYRDCLDKKDQVNAQRWKKIKMKAETDLIKMHDTMYGEGQKDGGNKPSEQALKSKTLDTELSRKSKHLL